MTSREYEFPIMYSTKEISEMESPTFSQIELIEISDAISEVLGRLITAGFESK